MAEVEKIADDRYRIRAHDRLITVSAQDLRDIADWCLSHQQELEYEAQAAARVEAYNRDIDERNRIIRENVPKPWLPLQPDE